MARKKEPTTTNTAITDFDFEQALSKLDQLIKQMEAGGLRLDESLIQFEEGISLVRHCQQALKDAEQKIHLLIEKNGHLEMQVFDSEIEQ